MNFLNFLKWLVCSSPSCFSQSTTPTRNTTRDALGALRTPALQRSLSRWQRRVGGVWTWKNNSNIPGIPRNSQQHPRPTPGPPCVLDRTWCQAACAGRRPTRNGCTSRGTPGKPTWTTWCSPDWESKHHGYRICINNEYTVCIICINMYITCINMYIICI